MSRSKECYKARVLILVVIALIVMGSFDTNMFSLIRHFGLQPLGNSNENSPLKPRPAEAESRIDFTSLRYGKRQNELNKLGCRKLPDIFIIGFEKCGTDTLKKFLGCHSNILVTNAGMNGFFDPDYNKTLAEYSIRRNCIPKDRLLLEKLAVHGLPELVFEYIPDVKLIAIVKEPTEREMSRYLHLVDTKAISSKINFEAYVESLYVSENETLLDKRVSWEPKKSTDGDVKHVPVYVNRLRPWVNVFGLDKILILDGDKLVTNPVGELRKAEEFIGLEHAIKENHFYFNERKKFYCLKSGCMQKEKGRPHPVMKNSTRRLLKTFFRPYNEKFYELIGQRFPWD